MGGKISSVVKSGKEFSGKIGSAQHVSKDDLLQQIEMFELIFDCIYNGVMVTDADGYITHFNGPYGQFLGLDPSVLDDEFGYQSNDQRHVLKLDGTYFLHQNEEKKPSR